MYSALVEAGEGWMPDSEPTVKYPTMLFHFPPSLKDAIVNLPP